MRRAIDICNHKDTYLNMVDTIEDSEWSYDDALRSFERALGFKVSEKHGIHDSEDYKSEIQEITVDALSRLKEEPSA